MNKMMSCVLMLYITFIAGCIGTSSERQNDYPYQPLVKPPHKTTAIVKWRAHNPLWPESFYHWMVWKSGIWLDYNADRTVDKCLSYIEKLGPEYALAEISMPLEDIPRDIRYPWLWDYYIIRIGGGNYDRNGMMIQPRKDKLPVYNKIRTIVSLEPLIIIQTNGIIINYPFSWNVSNHKASPYRKEIQQLFGGKSSDYTKMYVLKNGFAYGTRILYDPKPEWFSPDMKTFPQPVKIDKNAVGHIAVSWGEILLTKQGDEWIVTSKKQ